MSSNFGSTKFWLALVVIIASTVLAGIKILDGTAWAVAVNASLAFYCAANVAEQFTPTEPTTPAVNPTVTISGTTISDTTANG